MESSYCELLFTVLLSTAEVTRNVTEPANYRCVLRESPAHTDQVHCRQGQAVMAAIVLGIQQVSYF